MCDEQLQPRTYATTKGVKNPQVNGVGMATERKHTHIYREQLQSKK